LLIAVQLSEIFSSSLVVPFWPRFARRCCIAARHHQREIVWRQTGGDVRLRFSAAAQYD